MKTINVVAALIVHDGKIFATQRGYGEWRGWWDLRSVKWFPADEAILDEIERLL